LALSKTNIFGCVQNGLFRIHVFVLNLILVKIKRTSDISLGLGAVNFKEICKIPDLLASLSSTDKLLGGLPFCFESICAKDDCLF